MSERRDIVAAAPSTANDAPTAEAKEKKQAALAGVEVPAEASCWSILFELSKKLTMRHWNKVLNF